MLCTPVGWGSGEGEEGSREGVGGEKKEGMGGGSAEWGEDLLSGDFTSSLLMMIFSTMLQGRPST